MNSLFIEFGDGVRVFWGDQEILKLIFNVDMKAEQIELISITQLKELTIRKHITDTDLADI